MKINLLNQIQLNSIQLNWIEKNSLRKGSNNLCGAGERGKLIWAPPIRALVDWLHWFVDIPAELTALTGPKVGMFSGRCHRLARINKQSPKKWNSRLPAGFFCFCVSSLCVCQPAACNDIPVINHIPGDQRRSLKP